jgi:hypothetical protein
MLTVAWPYRQRPVECVAMDSDIDQPRVPVLTADDGLNTEAMTGDPDASRLVLLLRVPGDFLDAVRVWRGSHSVVAECRHGQKRRGGQRPNDEPGETASQAHSPARRVVHMQIPKL